jgi:hypothetical protein
MFDVFEVSFFSSFEALQSDRSFLLGQLRLTWPGFLHRKQVRAFSWLPLSESFCLPFLFLPLADARSPVFQS